MEVFRISQDAFAKKLTASGNANRWNFKGENVIYTGSSRSLSTLELIVHRASIIPSVVYKVLVISIVANKNFIKQIPVKKLPVNWRDLAAYPILQAIGSKWYNNQESLLLKVPSAVITKEYNYIINTEHPHFKTNIKLVKTEDYFWDSRLL